MTIKNNFIVSVIMNCHNGEKFLKESINSLINQTYTNWELIFYDNFSSDKSLSIVTSFNDHRIKIYKSKSFINLYHARNEAIKKVCGKYIFFLDTDDFWEKNKVEEQVKFMEKNNQFSMVYSNFFILDEKKKRKNVFYNFLLPEGKITDKILKKYTIGILTVCIKKQMFVNKNFEESFNVIGDFDFFVNLSIDHSIGCIQKPLACYRTHEDNYSKKNIKIHINELKSWIRSNNLKFAKLGYSLFYQRLYLFKLKIKKIFLGM